MEKKPINTKQLVKDILRHVVIVLLVGCGWCPSSGWWLPPSAPTTGAI